MFKRKRKILGIFFFIAGIIVFIIITPVVIQGIYANNWATTEGTIIGQREIEQCGSSAFVPVYFYMVDNVFYESTRIDFYSVICGDTNDLLSNYPVGSHVIVHYDPKNPNSAVLNSISGIEYVYLIISSLFIGYGVSNLLPAKYYGINDDKNELKDEPQSIFEYNVSSQANDTSYCINCGANYQRSITNSYYCPKCKP